MGIGFGKGVDMVSSFAEAGAKLFRFWSLSIVLSMVLLGPAGAETSDYSEPSLLLMESPFGSRFRYQLSCRLKTINSKFECEIVGSVPGGGEDSVSVQLSHEEGRAIVDAYKVAQWDWLETFPDDGSRHIEPVREHHAEEAPEFTAPGYIFVVSLTSSKGRLFRNLPLNAEELERSLVDSFFQNPSVRAAAREMVLRVGERVEDGVLEPRVWNVVLGLELD